MLELVPVELTPSHWPRCSTGVSEGGRDGADRGTSLGGGPSQGSGCPRCEGCHSQPGWEGCQSSLDPVLQVPIAQGGTSHSGPAGCGGRAGPDRRGRRDPDPALTQEGHPWAAQPCTFTDAAGHRAPSPPGSSRLTVSGCPERQRRWPWARGHVAGRPGPWARHKDRPSQGWGHGQPCRGQCLGAALGPPLPATRPSMPAAAHIKGLPGKGVFSPARRVQARSTSVPLRV